MRQTVEVYDTPFSPEEVANGVVHPVTKKTITKYKQLIADPITRQVWEKGNVQRTGASHPRIWRDWFNISHQGYKHNEIP